MKTDILYDAVSGFDEKFVSAAEDTDAIRKSFHNNRVRKIKTIGSICACVAVVIAVGWFSSQKWFLNKPALTQNTSVTQESTSFKDNYLFESAINTQTTDAEQTTAPANIIESQISKTESHTQPSSSDKRNQQEAVTKVQPTTVPSSTKITETPTAHSVEPTSAEATTIAEEPQNIYKDVRVDYNTAKTYFGYPIVPCNRNDFTGYSVLLVSPNGNNDKKETECLSVTYLFTNGSVVVQDQGKTGKITPTGKQYEYQGKTFYVHTPEFNGDNIRIGDYPNGDSGIAYQAHFNSGTDVNEIMDLMLSLEM